MISRVYFKSEIFSKTIKKCVYWYKCITTIVDWLNMIFYWLLRHFDGTHVNEPSKDKSVDGVDEIAEMLNKKLTIDDNSRHGMSSSTPSLPGEDVIEGGFVHIPNATDTSENKDNR